MKRILLIIPFIFLLTSCSTKKELYSWEKYEITSYNYLKNSDEPSMLALINNYEKIIAKQTGTRGIVPPGIYADYGYLLLQKGETNKGKEMLKQEIALYPESKIFIDRILKMTEE